MLTAQLYSIISVIVVSLISFIGIFTLSMRDDMIKKYMTLFISLAIGALLGDAFIHIIPESLETLGSMQFVVLLLAIGMVIFFIIEKFLHWHHHLEDEDAHKHESAPVGKLILISDGLHNFVDGLIVAASYFVSIELGIATTIAVILHEIPQEIGDFGVLIHAGFSKVRALIFNFFSGLFAVAGAVTFFALGESVTAFVPYILPIAAGGFIYIAIADLLPIIFKYKPGTRRIIARLCFVTIGVLAMVMLLALE